MNFRIVRDASKQTVAQTVGMLYAEDLDLPTLELPWKNNLPNVSCIPTGSYSCILTWSNRFQRIMPRLLDVPDRTGILIHGGEVVANTEGCILVGLNTTPDGNLINGLSASATFRSWLGVALKDGIVTCEVSYG